MTRPPSTAASRPADPMTAARHARDEEEDRGVGWLVFAAIVIALAGVLNGIYGIAAISSSDFYAKGADYVVGSLKTYGWLSLAIGALQFAAALGILAFTQWGRWLGIASASVNAVVQLLAMPAAPFLGLALFAIDVVVVYGLVVYGGPRRPHADDV